MDEEKTMKEWDYWRKRIADGDKSSAPRDWFESILWFYCSESEAITNSTAIDYTPFMPAHVNYSDCPGIFDILTEKGFVCNECGINLNELLATTNSTGEYKLRKIKDWVGAYPLEVFPEPDFKKVAKVLKENGMSIDCVSASNMRHVLNGIKDIIDRE